MRNHVIDNFSEAVFFKKVTDVVEKFCKEREIVIENYLYENSPESSPESDESDNSDTEINDNLKA
jgi:hypothetical protein